MADVRPFSALRSTETDLSRVIAPPYDVIDPALRAALASRSPSNIVRVDLPEGPTDEKYAAAARELERWIADGRLRRDVEPALYPYAQTFRVSADGPTVTRRGFFGLVRAEPYERRVVLPHERTLTGPKEDRYKLFVATKTALSPVFLLYRDASGATADALRDSAELASFSTDDGIEHRLGRVTDRAAIDRVHQALTSATMLIADGHHRYETTLRYGAEHVLAFLVDEREPGLVVLPTHRIVRGIGDFDQERFVESLRDAFDVEEIRMAEATRLAESIHDGSAPTFVALLRTGRALHLRARTTPGATARQALASVPAVLRATDVAFLHAVVIEGLLGVSRDAQAKESNVAYAKTIADVEKKLGEPTANVAFIMRGTPVDHVRAAASAGEVMPQKSTFFYPKVPTGLVLYPFEA